MDAFLISAAGVAVAEIGDRTQLLALMLAARYPTRPWPLLAGILIATLVNHALAGLAGASIMDLFPGRWLDAALGVGFLAMAAWLLRPDIAGDAVDANGRGPFLAALMAFFVAEIGDKTQFATVALAAQYPDVVAVVLGTTVGMMIANVPAVLVGRKFADRLPVRTIHLVAAALFAVLGVLALWRAFGA
ncbi:MAG: TMEM165/GDT1 family protein [Alphaproteobacteria bacterium]|nr:TMEM165/GDT1 family protein [Alphaproteobacteria bacterium]